MALSSRRIFTWTIIFHKIKFKKSSLAVLAAGEARGERMDYDHTNVCIVKMLVHPGLGP